MWLGWRDPSRVSILRSDIYQAKVHRDRVHPLRQRLRWPHCFLFSMILMFILVVGKRGRCLRRLHHHSLQAQLLWKVQGKKISLWYLAFFQPPIFNFRVVTETSRRQQNTGANMGWCNLNTVVLRTPTGILKILEFVSGFESPESHFVYTADLSLGWNSG